MYLALMTLADPLGSFAQTPEQLRGWIAVLARAPVSQEAGTLILNNVLTQQSKILASAPSYPMIDPYNPVIGFTTRQTDTLFAIVKALRGANLPA